MSSARPIRQRKAPKRFDDDPMYFDKPPAKRQPKEQSIVEVVAATVAPVIAAPSPIQPAAVKEPEIPKQRKYTKCGHHKCDCTEITKRRLAAMKHMKTPEKAAPKKIESAKKTIVLKENCAPLATATIKTHYVKRLMGG